MAHVNFDIDDIKNDLIEYLTKKTPLTRKMAQLATEVSKNFGKSDFTIQLAKVLHSEKNGIKNIIADVDLQVDDFLVEVSKSKLCYNVKIDKTRYCDRIYTAIMSSEVYDAECMSHKARYYGSKNMGKGNTIAIDFSSPNIAKKFHAGHLRTTILGNFLSNLYKYLNFKVVRINHLGDWGKQFGLVGVGFKKYGNEDELNKDAIKHLLEVYIKINQDLREEKDAMEEKLTSDMSGMQINGLNSSQDEKLSEFEKKRNVSKIDQEAKDYFAALERGDEEKMKQWKRFRSLSIEKYKVLYSTLNIKFDVYGGESLYAKAGLEVIGDAEIDTDSSMFYDLGELGKLVVRKSDGSTLYSTRDLAAAEDRIKSYNPVKLVYVVASQQDLYFKQLFSVLRGECGNKRRIPDGLELEHISFGMVNGLSTRKGNLVFLEDIIDAAKEAMHNTMIKNKAKYDEIENVEDTCTTLAVSAMIIQDFGAKRAINYTFDMKRNTSSEGETGPYLQYTHCRLMSIRKKNSVLCAKIDADLLSDDALNLIFYLSKFGTAVNESYTTSEPCKLVTYLMKLSKQVNSLFSTLRVFGEEEKLAQARLAVFEASRKILNNGMKILGMKPLERM
ncbi:arginine-tRNA ligase [Vavraia culicis subsp. floridensis]|uniref:arginine--tRNA ligase n=1 Tax=Vavraia culicis (isolate floridensis) TaxID=948595 RepID=L2GTR5_VAVCU|nr:arginine-tRNA ligase [Vavraia culicis subsp. floridensis]ELA46757.1 arginine-tRNA ligase [Vavraia culicis subsp. floridensis]